MKKRRILISFLMITSILVTLYCQYPLLINKYAINDDVRQVSYFYSQHRDPELFQGDFIVDYHNKWWPWGMNIVIIFYSIVGLFYDPIQFTKILPFFLCSLSALYMFKIGELLRGAIAGFLAGLMFIFVVWSRESFETFGQGNVKEFSVLFCIMFLYYFLKKDFFKAGINTVLLALFYPPLLLVCLSTYAISLLFDFFIDHKIEQSKFLIFIGAVIIIIAIFVSQYPPGQIKLISLKEMRGMEEFYRGGRIPALFPSFYERWANEESGLAIDYPIKWLVFVSLLVFLILRKKALNTIPSSLWNFIFVSFTLFIISNIFMFFLYGPSRYVRYSLPFFLILFIALNIGELYEVIKFKGKRLFFLWGFVFFVFISFIPKLDVGGFIIAPFPNLYRFLQTLPKDVLIAGHPSLMDNVPTFAERKAFITEEASVPYYTNFYPIIKERTYNFFKAYYSDSLKEIYDFCKMHNINYIIVDKKHFSNAYFKGNRFYLNPFNGYIKNLIKNKTTFALMSIPQNKRIFEDNDVFVVKVEGLLAQEITR